MSGDEEGPSATLSKSVIEEPSSPVNDISQTSGSCSSRACSEMKCVSSSGDASPPETPCSDDTPMASTSYLYSSIIHYKPDLKDTQPATDLSPTQPQPVSQRSFLIVIFCKFYFLLYRSFANIWCTLSGLHRSAQHRVQRDLHVLLAILSLRTCFDGMALKTVILQIVRNGLIQ